MTQVPSQYQSYVTDAATQLGIPEAVVAAQINLESGWDPNAVSGAGAQGIAQFMPGTFADYGHGSPFIVSDAFAAYISYMGTLLGQEGGNLRKALEAYNAGPGNLGAGASYASDILSAAGTGDVTVSGGGGSASQAFNPLNPGDWLGSLLGLGDTAQILGVVFGPIANVFKDFANALSVGMTAMLWLVNPMNWVRIFAGIVGAVALVVGAVLVAKAA